MSIPDKNNPDGLGSYGKCPSRFVERPKDQSDQEKVQPNDATASPMGHTSADQEVFDEPQEELGRKLASKSNPPQTGKSESPAKGKPVPKPGKGGKA